MRLFGCFPTRTPLTFNYKEPMERSKKASTSIEPISIEVFGIPNAATLGRMKKTAGSGASVTISPDYIGGFLRQVETVSRRSLWPWDLNHHK